MRKVLILLLIVSVLSACGNTEEVGEEPERKDSITNAETMGYLERLLEPYLETSGITDEEEMHEVVKVMNETAIEITRELKRDYVKDIHAVDDLIALADLYNGLAEEVENNNVAFISAYGEDIGSQIAKIIIDYLDGDLPDNYAEVIGVSNIYDID